MRHVTWTTLYDILQSNLSLPHLYSTSIKPLSMQVSPSLCPALHSLTITCHCRVADSPLLPSVACPNDVAQATPVVRPSTRRGLFQWTSQTVSYQLVYKLTSSMPQDFSHRRRQRFQSSLHWCRQYHVRSGGILYLFCQWSDSIHQVPMRDHGTILSVWSSEFALVRLSVLILSMYLANSVDALKLWR